MVLAILFSKRIRLYAKCLSEDWMALLKTLKLVGLGLTALRGNISVSIVKSPKEGGAVGWCDGAG